MATKEDKKKEWSRERIRRGYWLTSFRYTKLNPRNTLLTPKQKEQLAPFYEELIRLKKLFNQTADLHQKNRELFYQTATSKTSRKEFFLKQKELLEILKYTFGKITEIRKEILKITNGK